MRVSTKADILQLDIFNYCFLYEPEEQKYVLVQFVIVIWQVVLFSLTAQYAKIKSTWKICTLTYTGSYK